MTYWMPTLLDVFGCAFLQPLRLKYDYLFVSPITCIGHYTLSELSTACLGHCIPSELSIADSLPMSQSLLVPAAPGHLKLKTEPSALQD